MTKLIIGCGYLGGRVAERWLPDGEVFVVTRSAARAGQLREAGLRPLVADITKPETLQGLPSASTVLFAVGFDRTSGDTIEQVYVQGLRHVLDHLPQVEHRLIYISSTGVYGNHDGGWVTEDSPCAPQRAGGRACLAAENLLASHALGTRALVLRLAGIYGPGRIPRRASLEAGEAIDVPRQGFLNLIHVDDAVAAVLAAEARGRAPRTYLVADGSPVERRAYFEELARLLHAPPPKFALPSSDSPQALRAADNKRISNRRMLEELQVALTYPSYREGLAQIIASERRA